MVLTRREFIELVGSGAATLGLSGVMGCEAWVKPVRNALAEKASTTGSPPVIWLQGQSCAGCSVSTLNTVHPDIVEVLTETISLEFHPNIMAAGGAAALKILDDAMKRKGEFVLVVEGSVLTRENRLFSTMGEKEGERLTAEEWVRRLGASAKAVLAVGTCATFGGVPAANPNPTGAQPVSKVLPQATIINIPGCPSHPDWVIGTVAHVLLFGMPDLDEHRRPTLFFGKLVHEQCQRRAYFEEGHMAEDYGEEGCLFELGCKGPISHCDAPIRSWNNRINWCVQSSSPCIGCCEPTFPDHEGEGLYAALPISRTYGIPWIRKG